MNKKGMQDRLWSALWTPLLVAAVAAGLIVGIGELLLALAHAKEEMAGIPEPLSVAAALALALLVLIGGTLLAKGGRDSQR